MLTFALEWICLAWLVTIYLFAFLLAAFLFLLDCLLNLFRMVASAYVQHFSPEVHRQVDLVGLNRHFVVPGCDSIVHYAEASGWKVAFALQLFRQAYLQPVEWDVRFLPWGLGVQVVSAQVLVEHENGHVGQSAQVDKLVQWSSITGQGT